MGQCPVIESLEHLCFKEEALAVSPARINYLFERKQALLDMPIADKIDSAKPTLTKEALYRIAASTGMLYGSPNWERCLFLQQAAPREGEKLPLHRSFLVEAGSIILNSVKKVNFVFFSPVLSVASCSYSGQYIV